MQFPTNNHNIIYICLNFSYEQGDVPYRLAHLLTHRAKYHWLYLFGFFCHYPEFYLVTYLLYLSWFKKNPLLVTAKISLIIHWRTFSSCSYALKRKNPWVWIYLTNWGIALHMVFFIKLGEVLISIMVAAHAS